jgi:glycosyltransferase involved in cell wall biosynthesis
MNVEYVGQYGTSGYAVAAKGNILYLDSQGHNVTFSPLMFDDSKVDTDSDIDKKVCSKIKTLDYYDVQIIHTLPNLWPIVKERIKKKFPVKQIGFCTWENDSIPKNWIYEINKMDELWVPSQFNKLSFEFAGVSVPITVFPHIFLNQKLPDKSSTWIRDFNGNSIPHDKFTYYCIAEYSDRKGIDDLIECFNVVNDSLPETQLLLKLHDKGYSSDNKRSVINRIKTKTRKLEKSIYLITDNLKISDIQNIHALGDCYVSLHKGEGFGLCLYDAFNYKKQIISTNYGGPLDYLTENENIKLINYHKIGSWAYPDLGNAINNMKHFYKLKNS